MSNPFLSLKDVDFWYKSKVFAGMLLKKACTGPYMVAIQGSYSCNYKCVFCEWFSPLLKKTNEKVNNSNGYMSMEVYQNLVTELSKLGTKIIIIGDLEPFMDPLLIQKIEYAKQHNLAVMIITNGSFLTEEKVKQLVNLKLDYLNVSLNAGTAITYPRIHGTETEKTFERIVSIVSLVEKIKNEKGSSFPHTRLSMVVCNKNYHEIVKFVELCQQTGVKNAHLKRLIAPSSKEILTNLGLTPSQQKETERYLAEALSIGQKNGVEVSVEWADWTEHQKGQVENEKMPCYYGWLFSIIDDDGNVYACCFQKGNQSCSLGNINENSFTKIWGSKKYQDFRKNHKNISERRKMGYQCNQTPCFFVNKQVSNILHKPYLLPFRLIT